MNKKLGIQYPIIQAPMAGGITTPELAFLMQVDLDHLVLDICQQMQSKI